MQHLGNEISQCYTKRIIITMQCTWVNHTIHCHRMLQHSGCHSLHQRMLYGAFVLSTVIWVHPLIQKVIKWLIDRKTGWYMRSSSYCGCQLPSPCFPAVTWWLLLETGQRAQVDWPRTATHTLIPYLFVDFPLSLAVLLRKVEIALQWWNVKFFTSETVVILISFPFPIM